MAQEPETIDTAVGRRSVVTDVGDKFAKLRFPHERATSELAKLTAAAKPAADAMSRLQEQTRAISDRMRPAINALNTNSAMATLSRRLADQYKAIDALRLQTVSNSFSTPRLPDLTEQLTVSEIRLPPNPIVEANKHLARIEKRFDRMESIAVESASIATGLQASAANFLVKFEKAASDNNRTAKRAVLVGICAVLIALAMPIAQITYTEYWRVPTDAASTRSIITDLKRDITELQNTQRLAADRLSNALAQSNGDISVTLKDIRDLLARQTGNAE